jgi:hypothetical protein
MTTRRTSEKLIGDNERYERDKRLRLAHLREVRSTYLTKLDELAPKEGSARVLDDKSEDRDDSYYKAKEVLSAVDLFEFFFESDMARESEEERKKIIAARFRDFIKQHPVVINYMISMGAFSIDAFIKYIDRLFNRSIQTMNKDEHYHKAQSMYYAYLVKEFAPTMSKKKVAQRTKEIARDLKKNDEEIVTLTSKIKKEFTENEHVLYEQNKAELLREMIADLEDADA